MGRGTGAGGVRGVTESAIRIVPFDARFAPAFAALNKRWITEHFALEPQDLLLLDDPQRNIIDAGGQIFFAIDGDAVLGTAAAVPYAPSVIELGKMAVAPEGQGRGIGRRLGEAVIAYARESGAQTLFLLSNVKLATALRLYARLGFVRVPLDHAHGYARAGVRMEMRFD